MERILDRTQMSRSRRDTFAGNIDVLDENDGIVMVKFKSIDLAAS
jgi:hypothetical protein